MELITPSGGLLFWMVLVFAIVFFILAKFGFPAITGMVNKRKDHINSSLLDAAKAKEELAGIQLTCDKMLAETRTRQAAILEEARQASARIVEESRAEASRQAEQILKKAGEDVEVMKNDAIDQVRGVVVTMSVAIAEKILRKQLSTDAAQEELIRKMIEEARTDEQRNNS